MSALPSPSPTPSPSTPFARPDDAADLARGTTAASLAPVVSSNIFDGRKGDAAAAGAAGATVPAAMETAAVAVDAADAERFPPPPHSQPPAPSAGSSPPGGFDTGALYESSLRGRRSRVGSRSGIKSGSDNNWADKRGDNTKHPMGGGGGGGGGVEGRGKGGGKGGNASSSGGSLWMQAAAAVEKKSTASGSSGRGLGTSGNISGKSRGLDSLSGGGGGGGTVASTGYGTGKVSPGGGAGSVQSGSAGARRRPRRGSASSTDDGDSLSTSSWAEGADADLRGSQQQQQHRWGGEASVMAAAAEEVAALNAAKDHPEAKRAEDRMLVAQANVNHALTVLERRLVSLVTRQAPMPSPRPAARPTEARARRGFSSTYPSPRGPRSPCAPSLAEEQQPQRWVAVAPTGAAAATAPLAAAAALLMERAWSFRKDLVGAVDKLRERSVALAVAEVFDAAGDTGGGGGGTAAMSAAVASAAVAGSAAVPGAALGGAPVVGGGWAPAQSSQSPPLLTTDARRFALSDRQGFVAGATDEARRGLRGEGLRGEGAAESTVGGVAGSLALHRTADTRREEPPRPATAAAAGGVLLGVSCCLDFDRILGEDSLLPGSAEGLRDHGRSEEGLVGSPLFSPAMDSIGRLGPVSGRGVVAVDRPLLGFGRTAMQSGSNGGGGGSAGGLSARERRHSDDPPRIGVLAPDSWALVLRDVSAAEDRCREYVSAWESAGGALGEACDDLGSDDVRGLAGVFAPQ